MKKNTFYNYEKIKDSELIIYHHLGLGDHLICNGLVNYLSLYFNTIFLPVKQNNLSNVSYLYKENNKVRLFEVSYQNEEEGILDYSQKNNLKILKIGLEKIKNPFNTSFYEQLNLPYSISKDFFSFPRNIELEDALYKHLIENFEVKSKFALIHSEASTGTYDLRVDYRKDKIYIKKDMDIFNNIFYYSKLIELAEEIHCLNSSFLHLVDRCMTTDKLYFHDLKGANKKGEMTLLKNWKIINY